MEKHLGFRAWFYFRNGWSLYFAFIFAAINTLTVTYYLAIERIPSLLLIFPSFLHYIVIVTFVGIPLLIFIGYAHYKKTAAFRSEVDISMETNPYQRRMVVNTEAILRLNLKLLDLILKSSAVDKASKKDLENIVVLQNEISQLLKNRTFTNEKDLEFFRNIDKKISF
ncbi:MAG: hypothetical protein K5798_05260 [Nitrosopumilus sp.]|uniref:hypothetical protein n=1 Tax=Nitrosopumilus sp. TaxID=2024843 RepID=UPI00242C7383|nr:hypothetical protein [Nitrosopumilus sp.]MCV0366653.1 hypothetical protein [Nitrosopumilus sp.]